MKRRFVLILISLGFISSFVNAANAAEDFPSNEILKKKAAFALNVAENQVVIEQKSRKGVKTDFIAKTAEESYRCYVISAVMPTSTTVSDAICAGSNGEPAGCNKQLREAGGC